MIIFSGPTLFKTHFYVDLENPMRRLRRESSRSLGGLVTPVPFLESRQVSLGEETPEISIDGRGSREGNLSSL